MSVLIDAWLYGASHAEPRTRRQRGRLDEGRLQVCRLSFDEPFRDAVCRELLAQRHRESVQENRDRRKRHDHRIRRLNY